MKVIPSFLALATFQVVAFAAATRELIIPREADLSERELTPSECVSVLNEVLGIVSQYPQYTSTIVAFGEAGLSGATAYSLCRTFRVERIDCGWAATTIGTAMSLAVVHGFQGEDPKEKGAVAGTPDSLNRRADHLYARTQEHLLHSSLEYRSLEVTPTISKRDGASGHTIEVRNARHQGQQGEPVDYIIDARQDGLGQITAVPSNGDPLVKRAGAGYKITYQVNGRTLDMPTQNAYEGLSRLLAKDWQDRVEKNQKIKDYIGMMDFASLGSIQVRIIPELEGFAETYEDVNTLTTFDANGDSSTGCRGRSVLVAMTRGNSPDRTHIVPLLASHSRAAEALKKLKKLIRPPLR
ncbi:hypothetical protein F4778DRAFT_781013 [Xylariomycetidae sp. FL2044]|nr:hypothetical protein F4778DRAFT_781013 [Xylariomycetidae sp. FL2044]